ncbi:Uncharacterised protein [Mycobacteroides abscessus subsp. massiliense]|uniref:hypothetical protein n=1 Tax=Mycobacteriaceae TaxID=1762 RepID=UPI0009294022|nr:MULTISPECIES: hypothetical protein [Mycobacteriaceae]MCW1823177.1 hypothetical protein [Mycolicibacterium senegalense]SIH17109.1 Uncharacterised protein [Mycobacteroides abscessus subsp. abscessus]SLG53821.1 Uncharacterised protein [Mycobacteroides abscessus subsp. massiliense]SLH95358.1 Uncharacterised protein [Mycobacteroides abscessus subsp. massiliense]
MNRTKSLAAVGLALAAVTVTAACGTGPAPQTSAAPTSPTVAAPALAPQKVVLDDLPAWVDTIGARNAAVAGQPFLFPERDAGGESSACFTYMRMPNSDIWVLNRPDTAPAAGMAMSPRRDLYSCGGRGFGYSTWEARRSGGDQRTPSPAVSPRPEGVPDLSSLSNAVDLNAAHTAMKAGLPFMFAAPSGGVAACHSAVLMPDGQIWVLNETGPVPIGGTPLDRTVKENGCSARGGVR